MPPIIHRKLSHAYALHFQLDAHQFHQIDSDGDGFLNFNEFLKVLEKLKYSRASSGVELTIVAATGVCLQDM